MPEKNKRIINLIGLIFLLSFLAISLTSAFALEPVILNEETLNGYPLGLHLEYLEDKGGRLTIDDLTGERMIDGLQWNKSNDKSPGFGYTSSAYWVRFTINNPIEKEVKWYLEISYPGMDYFELFIPDKKEGYIIKKGGDDLPFEDREIIYRYFLFHIKAQVKSSLTYYIRFKTESSMNIPVAIWSPFAHNLRLNNELPFLWLFYGLLICMIIYNIFIFVSVRDNSYLYYVLYVISFLLFFFSYHGHAYQYLWPNLIWWNSQSLPILIPMVSLFSAQFTRLFLQTKREVPFWDKILCGIMIFSGGSILFSLFGKYPLAIKLALISSAMIVIFMIVAIILVKRGSRQARFYLGSWIAMIIGAVVLILMTVGVLPANFFTRWALQIGTSWQAVILALGLSDQINTMKNDLQALNVDLESKVEERTGELIKSEEKFRHIVDNVNDTIYRSDWMGNFKYMNPIGLNKLGYKIEEIVKINYIDIIHPDYKEEVFNIYSNQLKQKIKESYCEFQVVTKNGESIWVGQNVRLVEDRDGNIEFYCIARDITEKKEAEEALQELDRQKSRFFANISHEIRTPLTLILSPIESVLQGDYGKEIDNKFFVNLHRNAIRLLKLINNMLDFSKIEAGRMTMEIREADIIRFIKNYVATVHSASESKGIKVDFISFNESVENLYFDLEKMDKVVMNILSNSLKFTERGGEIKIRVKDDDIYCYVEFEDTGAGIPKDRLSSIFDRFSQADSSSTRKYEGTGIGLSLAKELVNLHGGTISVKSKFIEDYPDEHGTIFTITLLKGKEHFKAMDGVEFIAETKIDESVSDNRRFIGMREMDDIMGKEEPHEVEVTSPRIHAEKPTMYNILIVEDNPDMRDFLKFLLQERYRIHLAENGKEGLEMAKELKPDLIVSDVMMPIMNGYEMTKKIKEDEELRIIPVIMLTARADVSYKIEGLEHGADDYLTKPFNSKELLVRIKTLLKTYQYEKIILKRNIEIEDELKIARLMQQKLLPQEIPEISGYSSHVIYLPMDQVGGDFYDYIKRDNFIDLFIADVSGHGIPGAFLSIITKTALESITNRSSTTDVQYILNDIICRSAVNYNYVTAFFCIIDTETNIIRYSNAGHCPPLIYRQESDEFYELKAKGNPLGWFESLEFTEEEIQLYSGDRLFLYTDGITECMDPGGKEFGEDGFKEFIRSNISLSPKLFSESLLDHLKKFSGSDKFDDDLCLLVFDLL